MTLEDGPTIETLRPLAVQTGLELSDDDLTAVLAGVTRNIEMAVVVRKWAALSVEPQTGALKPAEVVS